jgi:hypothetical protein
MGIANLTDDIAGGIDVVVQEFGQHLGITRFEIGI